MNTIFKLILKDKSRVSIERFPHDDEEGFIQHLIKHYNPIEITRYSDGVIVYELKEVDDAAKTGERDRTGIKNL